MGERFARCTYIPVTGLRRRGRVASCRAKFRPSRYHASITAHEQTSETSQAAEARQATFFRAGALQAG